MVILNYPFGKRQAQPPSSLLACKPGVENRFEPRLRNSLTSITDINDNLAVYLQDLDIDRSLAFHGIHGILTQVFDNPFKQMQIQGNNDLFPEGRSDPERNFLGNPGSDVGYGFMNYTNDIHRFQTRYRTDLGETVCNGFKPVYIFSDLRQGFM